MAQVDIRANGRAYKVTCDDGQEQRLMELAAFFDRRLSTVSKDLGQIGDARLMLLAALTVCDELFEVNAKNESLERAGDALGPDTAGAAARAVEAAADRVKSIAERYS